MGLGDRVQGEMEGGDEKRRNVVENADEEKKGGWETGKLERENGEEEEERTNSRRGEGR